MTNEIRPIHIMTQVADAVVEAVTSGGEAGVPGGVLYAAMSAHGCTITQFNTIMSVLCEYGKLRKSGERYFGNVATEAPAPLSA